MEKLLIDQLMQNWPTVTVALMLAYAFYRISQFIHRLERLEKSQKRLQRVCEEINPDRGAQIYKEED